MNIAFVNAAHVWGGVKTWCLDSAEQLAKRGHSPILYGRAGAFVDRAHERGLEAESCTFGVEFNPFTIAFFYREFKRRKIELCVCNVSKDMHSAGIAAHFLGIPIVQHLGAASDLRRSKRKFATIQILKPVFITPSEFVKRGLLANLPELAPYEIVPILPGCRVTPEFRQHVNSPRVITITSRLVTNKGHAELLKACSHLKEAGYQFRCRIVGTGKLEEPLKNLCSAMNLNDVVTFTGFVTNVAEELANGDIYVFPAENEGLGIALEEAMATGLPCIAKTGSGPNELWPQSHQHMLISEKDDGRELAHQIKRLLDMDDASLLAESRVFHNHALKNFAQEKQIEKLESFFTNVVERAKLR